MDADPIGASDIPMSMSGGYGFAVQAFENQATSSTLAPAFYASSLPPPLGIIDQSISHASVPQPVLPQSFGENHQLLQTSKPSYSLQSAQIPLGTDHMGISYPSTPRLLQTDDLIRGNVFLANEAVSSPTMVEVGQLYTPCSTQCSGLHAGGGFSTFPAEPMMIGSPPRLDSKTSMNHVEFPGMSVSDSYTQLSTIFNDPPLTGAHTWDPRGIGGVMQFPALTLSEEWRFDQLGPQSVQNDDESSQSTDGNGKTVIARDHGEIVGTSRMVSGRRYREYPCPDCHKLFARPSTLIQHKRIHTGERPYNCTVENCRQTFNILSNARRHAKRHRHTVENAEPFCKPRSESL